MKLIASADETEALAKEADPDSHAIVVPAFTGLGAPYWDPHARGAIFGMTRDTGAAEIVRASLESVSYQTRDLMDAMAADMKAAGLTSPTELRVDGGMVANNWFAQNLADILGRPVVRPEVLETTARGAAYLAAMQVGLFSSPSEVAERWQEEASFTPQMPDPERAERYGRWQTAVGRVLTS